MGEEIPKPVVFQEIIGSKITKLVLWGTIGIALVGVVFAFAALNCGDEARVKSAFSILQYIFGALLPLWGTWLGTVLAYYYSKQNFESANNSVKQMVDKLTSEKKLESVKAKDVMIANMDNKLKHLVLKTDEDLSKFKLKKDCLDFVKEQNIRRVLILDENDRAKYSIHSSLINEFLANKLLDASTPDAANTTNTVETPVPPTPPATIPASGNYTLMDMYKDPKYKEIFDNSVKFIAEDANLLVAKSIMEKYKTCQDVFITKTGDANEPVLGWITNITISEYLIV